MNTYEIRVQVDLNEGTDIESVAEHLFDFLARDDDDLFPEIETVNGFDFVSIA